MKTGAYFRIQRNGKWQSIDFAELTQDELDYLLSNMDSMQLVSMIEFLRNLIVNIEVIE